MLAFRSTTFEYIYVRVLHPMLAEHVPYLNHQFKSGGSPRLDRVRGLQFEQICKSYFLSQPDDNWHYVVIATRLVPLL